MKIIKYEQKKKKKKIQQKYKNIFLSLILIS